MEKKTELTVSMREGLGRKFFRMKTPGAGEEDVVPFVLESVDDGWVGGGVGGEIVDGNVGIDFFGERVCRGRGGLGGELLEGREGWWRGEGEDARRDGGSVAVGSR